MPEINWIYEDDSRIEPFEDRLRRLETQLIDPSDTSLLAGALVLGWLRVHPRYHHEQTFRHEDLFESKPLATLMKDNLGLHNAEIAGIIKALSLQKLLHNVEEFKKKGHRRKMSFLQSEAFPLALDLAHVDALLDPDTLEFWDTQLEILRTSGVEPGFEGAGPQHRNQPAHRRPRRRRRGPRKPPQ